MMTDRDPVDQYIQRVASHLFWEGYHGKELDETVDTILMDIEDLMGYESDLTFDKVVSTFGEVKASVAAYKLKPKVRLPGIFRWLWTIMVFLLLAMVYYSYLVNFYSPTDQITLKFLEIALSNKVLLMAVTYFYMNSQLIELFTRRFAEYDPRSKFVQSGFLYYAPVYYMLYATTLFLVQSVGLVAYVPSGSSKLGIFLLEVVVLSVVMVLSSRASIRDSGLFQFSLGLVFYSVVFPDVISFPILDRINIGSLIIDRTTYVNGNTNVITSVSFPYSTVFRMIWILLPIILGVWRIIADYRRREPSATAWIYGNTLILALLITGYFGTTLGILDDTITDVGVFGANISYPPTFTLSLLLIWNLAYMYLSGRSGRSIRLKKHIVELKLRKIDLRILFLVVVLILPVFIQPYQNNKSIFTFSVGYAEDNDSKPEGTILYSHMSQKSPIGIFNEKGNFLLTMVVPEKSKFSFELVLIHDGITTELTNDTFGLKVDSGYRVYNLEIGVDGKSELMMGYNLTVFAQNIVNVSEGLQIFAQFRSYQGISGWFGIYTLLMLAISQTPVFVRRE